MRRALTMLGPRGTVALVLILAVGAVVGVARLVNRSGGDGIPTFPSGPEFSDTATATPTSTEASGNDGVSTNMSASPKADPAAHKAATDFLKAWLRSNLSAAAWHAGIVKYATEALAAKLDGVDPASVPATRTTGAAEVTPQGVGLVEVAFPVDSGEVRLRVLRVNGAWLVDAVDWERA